MTDRKQRRSCLEKRTVKLPKSPVEVGQYREGIWERDPQFPVFESQMAAAVFFGCGRQTIRDSIHLKRPVPKR